MAVQAGADVCDAHWVYCRDAAACSQDPALQAMFLEAASSRGNRLSTISTRTGSASAQGTYGAKPMPSGFLYKKTSTIVCIIAMMV